MTKPPEVIAHWLDKVEVYGKGLSKWEESFIESLADQWAERNWVSDKQEEILERIYSDRT